MVDGYKLVIVTYSQNIYLKRGSAASGTVLGTYSNAYTTGVPFKTRVVWDADTGRIQVFVADVGSDYPQTPGIDVIDTQYQSGYVGCISGSISLSPGSSKIYNLQIIASEVV